MCCIRFTTHTVHCTVLLQHRTIINETNKAPDLATKMFPNLDHLMIFSGFAKASVGHGSFKNSQERIWEYVRLSMHDSIEKYE